MSDLAAALQVAIKVHAGQTDKLGQPYLLHVLKVVEAVDEPGLKVVAALHDVVEDSNLTIADLQGEFGWLIGEAVSFLTRNPADTYEQYIERIARSGLAAELAREVKVADLRDNLSRIPPEPSCVGYSAYDQWVRDWSGLKRRYERALRTLGAEVPA